MDVNFWLPVGKLLHLGAHFMVGSVGRRIVPIEILDIWFCHVRLPRWFSSVKAGMEIKEEDACKAYECRFVPVTLPLLLSAVLIIMWLAVARPM